MYDIKALKTICVCGAGTMGSGIAQLAAHAGFRTVQFDVSKPMLEKSRQSIGAALDKLTGKNKISEQERDAILLRMSFTDRIEDCCADLVIEAIVEKKEAKIELFNRLASINSAETIFATNTSSISVTGIAGAVTDPSRVAGMHFFNPAPLMKLVEIVRTKYVREEVIAALVAVAEKMGKTPVVCQDAPGFIVNRVARHYYLEAMKLVEDGLAEVDTVDAVMEATGFKMGPFRLMDLIGLDVNYAVSRIVWESLSKPERLRPSELQKKKVDKGELGRKTGKGFYHY